MQGGAKAFQIIQHIFASFLRLEVFYDYLISRGGATNKEISRFSVLIMVLILIISNERGER
jgi:hypothetical protein